VSYDSDGHRVLNTVQPERKVLYNFIGSKQFIH